MTIHFYDVSHHNGVFHPAGPTMAKATEGGSFVDEQYTATRGRVLAGGWPFAGYHFLRKGNIDAQARHAYSVIGKTPAMLDIETANDGSFPSWTDVKAFIAAYRKLGGALHLAYIPKWFWAGKWKSVSMKWLTDNDVALISSAYTSYSDGGPGWDAYGGVAPTIWQHTSTPLDTNAFKGTQDQLAALFAGSTTGDEDEMQDADWTKLAAMLKDNNTALLKTTLGDSGPVVGVALQSGYHNTVAILAGQDPAKLVAALKAAGLEVDVDPATLQTAFIGALKQLADAPAAT